MITLEPFTTEARPKEGRYLVWDAKAGRCEIACWTKLGWVKDGVPVKASHWHRDDLPCNPDAGLGAGQKPPDGPRVEYGEKGPSPQFRYII